LAEETAPAAGAPAAGTPAAGTPAAGPADPYCRNCGAPLGGAFCADCGQSADVHVPSTRELIHEALEDLTHSDSRLWSSLRYLLFVPGKLTTEFIAGRRVAYLPPFRLYLVLSVALFVINSWTGGTRIELPDERPTTVAGEAAKPAAAVPAMPTPAAQRCSRINVEIFGRHLGEEHLRRSCEKVASDRGESLMRVAGAALPKAMFIFLPLIALLHMTLYWSPRHRYAEHLLFFIHLHAFAFLSMTVMVLLDALGDHWTAARPFTGTLEAALGLYMPLYTLLAMKRVFRRGLINTLFKGFLLFLSYVTVLALTVAGVFIYALWQL
jgi:hypothetical protein